MRAIQPLVNLIIANPQTAASLVIDQANRYGIAVPPDIQKLLPKAITALSNSLQGDITGSLLSLLELVDAFRANTENGPSDISGLYLDNISAALQASLQGRNLTAVDVTNIEQPPKEAQDESALFIPQTSEMAHEDAPPDDGAPSPPGRFDLVRVEHSRQGG